MNKVDTEAELSLQSYSHTDLEVWVDDVSVLIKIRFILKIESSNNWIQSLMEFHK